MIRAFESQSIFSLPVRQSSFHDLMSVFESEAEKKRIININPKVLLSYFCIHQSFLFVQRQILQKKKIAQVLLLLVIKQKTTPAASCAVLHPLRALNFLNFEEQVF